MLRNHRGWRRSAPALGVLHQRPQRWHMKMVEMGVRDQNQINGREIVDLHSRLPQSLKYKKPARKIWINEDIFSADLHEKAGMPDKCDPHLPVWHQFRFMRLAAARGDRRMPDQLAKCSGTLAKSGILESLFQHGKAALSCQLLALSQKQIVPIGFS